MLLRLCSTLSLLASVLVWCTYVSLLDVTNEFLNEVLGMVKSILKLKGGYYRNSSRRSFPNTYLGNILILVFVVFRNFLTHVALPLSSRKRVIIPSDGLHKDFDEALTHVYFGSMYRLVEIKIPKGGVCVDVGAHYGFYTFRIADKCKLVVALEPAPNNFVILYNSLKYSGIRNVIALPFAAGEASYNSS